MCKYSQYAGKKIKKGMKNMKCELFSGVTYYTDNDNVCTDIDATPDVKSVILMHPIVNIDRNTCKKEYPNVEELIIRDNVTSISIPNRMFPNIKKVSSKSRYFSSGKYLIKRFRITSGNPQ